MANTINIPSFNLTADAERKLLALYVDVSMGAGQPEWEVQGYGSEEAGIEFSPDIETFVDVLGIQHNRFNKVERSVSFDPNTLRPTGQYGKLNEILHEYVRRGMLSHLQQFPVLVVYAYVGTVGAYAADVYPSCTIVPQSLGGSSRTDFPYDITFGGEPKFGTVDKMAPGLVFTEETAA